MVLHAATVTTRSLPEALTEQTLGAKLLLACAFSGLGAQDALTKPAFDTTRLVELVAHEAFAETTLGVASTVACALNHLVAQDALT
jgi:hypothetical protein